MRRISVATGEAARYREKAMEEFDGRCDRCGEPTPEEDIEVHHVDRDRSNYNLDNLERLCRGCHWEEHHGESPLWGMLVSMPRPVIELLDRAVEENNMYSRSEAVARAIINAYETDDEMWYGGPSESVAAWFGDDRHTNWVSDAVVEPGEEP